MCGYFHDEVGRVKLCGVVYKTAENDKVLQLVTLASISWHSLPNLTFRTQATRTALPLTLANYEEREKLYL